MRKLYTFGLVLLIALCSSVRLSAQCTPGAPQTFTNNTPLTIPTGPGVVTSTINVSGAPAFLYDVNVFTNLTHTFAADLDITIQSPAGTVVTLTTDNGAGNDNVFAGTTWDDNANPAGQVPYTTNNGLVTDNAYVNLTAVANIAPEEALAAFIGEDPNGVWTITISDDAAGDGGTLNEWSLIIEGLTAAPTLTNTTASNNTPVVIPTGPGVVTSTITISGAGTQIFDVDVLTNITHTFAADMDITIQSPAGTVVTLSTDNGAGNDNVFAGTTWDDSANPAGQVPYTTNNGLTTDNLYVNLTAAANLAPEEPLGAFIGEDPNGVWTITISDDAAGDGGTLNSWGLDIETASCSAASVCAPSAPQTFTNATPLTVPTGPAVVSSTITVAGAPQYLYDLNVFTNLTHTFGADLDITVQSPAGTVVTLTTDNGGGNDNIFAGTTWDDNANPAGQVPYTTNNGLVTDNTYVNLTPAANLVPEEALAAFIGENPNGVWTITVSDDLGGDGGTLNEWRLIMTGLPAAPTITTTPFTNNTPLAIPTGPAVVTSTINVSGAGTDLIDVDVLTNITHTFASDLDITIQSPAGTVVTLTTDNGAGNDNVFAGTTWDDNANPAGQVPYTTNNGMVTDHLYVNLTAATNLVPEEALGAFVGEDPNGIWTITISDDLAGDGGTLNSWGLNIKTATCSAPCSGVPSPGAITGPATVVCAGTPVNLSLAGQTSAPGITYQWRSSAVAGGPYTAISGATNSTYTFNATTTTYFICSVTCSNGGGTGNTVEFAVMVSNLSHSNVMATPSTTCSPGTSVVSGMVSGTAAVGNYIHTLVGPGTISAPTVSGAQNANVSFTVSALPAGIHNYTLTSTDAAGCVVTSPVTITVNPTPVITFTPASSTICAGDVQAITVEALPGAVQTFSSGTINLTIPDGAPTGVNTAPVVLPSGINIGSASHLKIRINARHSWVGDLRFTLTSPCGTTFLFDRPGVPPLTFGNSANLGTSNATTPPPAVYIFDLAAATVIPETAPGTGFIPTGSYRPSDAAGAAHNWAGVTFPCAAAGNWTLNIADFAAGDTGALIDWAILYEAPTPVVLSPATGLFTDAAATTPYVAGTPVNAIWASPATTTTYTANATLAGCNAAPVTHTVTVNQLPAITVQPVAPTAPVCPGFNVNFSVTATGTGITYQWQVSTDNGATWNNVVNSLQYSNVTTATLTANNVQTTQNGYRFRCIVSGVCPPPVTSNAVILVVATAPVITTQPASLTRCEGTSASFAVAATGVPAPTIYQWQVSTNGGTTYNNIATGTTPAFTIPAVTNAMNNNRYRVIVTNSCGQSTTSNAAILTVTPLTAISIAPLPSRICISDTLVALNATPAGGSWSGIGVSGFNFLPGITAVGTYNLTYTYTNAGGCTSTASVAARVEDCPERIRLLRDNGALLYPNPNSGQFFIKVNSTLYEFLGMSVYSSSGQEVYKRTFNGLVYGRVIPVNITHLPAGTYMVKVFYDDGENTGEKTFTVVIGR